ncbi:type II secretion system F family protein [Catenulispora yoronensis]|uniref:Type II secretion system F family protein n=2 Tax=Catenulispora yoronensis TaxID=450799 RepID=A0ABP5GB82_9ACTN
MAGVLAASAVLTFPGRGARRRLETAVLGRPRGPRWRVRWAGVWPTALSAVALGILCSLLARSTVLAILVPFGAWRGYQLWTARNTRLAVERRRAEIIELCVTLGAELRAGREAREALRVAAAGACPELALYFAGPPSAVGDVVQVLRTAAGTPGRESLAGLAACWQVADGGAGMVAAVGELVDVLRAERTQRRELDAELAGVRSSARLLALLPSLGLVIGSGMGLAPVPMLLHTGVGQGCLVLGIGFVAGGVMWMNRIAGAAEALS